jgi:hypothetical protein
MTDTNGAASDRLDSWKAIAAYLDRDIRTVRRWEQKLGLPVRRTPGARGHSVFAYVSEIDAWLQKTPLAEIPEDVAATRDAIPQPDLAASSRHDGQHRAAWRWRLSAAGIVAATAGLAWGALAWVRSDDALFVQVTPSAVVARDARGAERWRYAFPQNEQVVRATSKTDHPQLLPSGRTGDAVVATGYRLRLPNNAVSSGEMLWLTRDGRRTRRFAFDDRVAFGDEVFGEPWVIADYQIDRGTQPRVAVAAHHYHWWPSLVSVLDNQGRRRGTFVNAGWVERVHWLSPDRLLIAGFSNARDGGLVALLDADALDGQSPVADDPAFRCTSCDRGAPLRYVVLPRSEVNRITVSPFNRALLEVAGSGVIVRTVEVPSTGREAVDALYEFSHALDLQRASYSDRYWETHRALEAQGKLDHARAQCPERDGPRAIDVWTPQSGWRTIPAHRTK